MAGAARRSANAGLSTAAPLSGERAEATFERDRRRAPRAGRARTHECAHFAASGGAARGHLDGVAALARSRGHRDHGLLWRLSLALGTVTTSAGVARVSILPPPGETVYPDSLGVAVSPDGTMVAFVVGSVSRSENELWIRSLESMSARRLEGLKVLRLPFWSPDGRRIGFFTNSKLKIVTVAGGRVETLTDAPSGRGATWNRSNVIVFAPDAGGPLFRISANGGTPEPLTTLDSARKEYGHRFATFLPDGERFLYTVLPGKNGKFDIFAGSLSDQSKKLVGSLEATPVFAEPGWLLYARQGVLVALPFDSTALTITGDPVVLEDEPSSILDPSISWTAGWSVSVSVWSSRVLFGAVPARSRRGTTPTACRWGRSTFPQATTSQSRSRQMEPAVSRCSRRPHPNPRCGSSIWRAVERPRSPPVGGAMTRQCGRPTALVWSGLPIATGRRTCS